MLYLLKKSHETLLGTCTVQLDALLDNRIGVRGWLPIHPLVGNHILLSLIDEKKTIGGLEIAVRFAKSDDYVRVLDAAQQIGWQRLSNGLPSTSDYVSGRNVAPKTVPPTSSSSSWSTDPTNLELVKPSSLSSQTTNADNRSVKCLVEIERAVHLACVYETTSNRHVAPNAFVTFQSSNGTGGVNETQVCARQISPHWNYQLLVAISAEYFVDDNKYFRLKVYHRAGENEQERGDKLLGNVCIDLQPLICGLTHISGWYNIQVLTYI